jgi:hypothetical protein
MSTVTITIETMKAAPGKERLPDLLQHRTAGTAS